MLHDYVSHYYGTSARPSPLRSEVRNQRSRGAGEEEGDGEKNNTLVGVIKFALIIVNNFISHFNRSIKTELLIYECELRH